MISEADILDALREEQVQLPPLIVRVGGTGVRGDRSAIDAIIEVEWGGRSWIFAAEIKRMATPKAVRDALAAAKLAAERLGLNPMIVVPYLSPNNIALLESEIVSGLDLCGNGIVVVPGEVLIVRTGNPNRFPQSAPIRNVYRGDSSLVARVFLTRPEFKTVSDIQEAIQELGGNVTLSTVSKVLKALEEDLIVAREPGIIRLLQADKLLEQLAVNYRPPKVKDRFIGRVELPEPELQQALATAARQVGSRFVLTGAASASQYAVLAREPVVAAYCSIPPDALLQALGASAERTDRFPNLDLTWTTDSPVFFDPTIEGDVPYASPVQSYLELAAGDKRQRETADQVREYVLSRVEKAETTR